MTLSMSTNQTSHHLTESEETFQSIFLNRIYSTNCVILIAIGEQENMFRDYLWHVFSSLVVSASNQSVMSFL